ncbi:LuxR C-terminal-related transcriptional regulator [Nocardia salmonicida]|uniref:LuxR C-terminal-related transcriptional regulator n=1 Tax=Nocardia salmonicida TaxID=53431 RepID=UPI0033ED11FF
MSSGRPCVAFDGYPDAGLSTREIEVLLAWIRADAKARVARELFITPATINTHLHRIRAKYGAVGRLANTKAALVARALQDNLIGLDEL